MSEYGGYGNQAETIPRYGYPADLPEVLARVPDMQGEPPPADRYSVGSRPARDRQPPLSARLVGTVSTLVLVAGVAGFLMGRSGQSNTSTNQGAWRPDPPAAGAPEAPVWPGAEMATAPSSAPSASPVLSVQPVGAFESAPVAGPGAAPFENPRGGLVPLGPPSHAAAGTSAAPTTTSENGSRRNPSPWELPAAQAGGNAPVEQIASTPYPAPSYPPNSTPPTSGSYPPGSYPPASYPPVAYPPNSTPPNSGSPAAYPPAESYAPPAPASSTGTGVTGADRFTNPYAQAVANGQIGTPVQANYQDAPPPSYAGANQSMRIDPYAAPGQSVGPAAPAVSEGYYSPNDPRMAVRPQAGAMSPSGSGANSGVPPYNDARGQAYPAGNDYRGSVYPPNGAGAYAPPAPPSTPWPGQPVVNPYASQPAGGGAAPLPYGVQYGTPYAPQYSESPAYPQPGAVQQGSPVEYPSVRTTP